MSAWFYEPDLTYLKDPLGLLKSQNIPFIKNWKQLKCASQISQEHSRESSIEIYGNIAGLALVMSIWIANFENNHMEALSSFLHGWFPNPKPVLDNKTLKYLSLAAISYSCK